MKVLSIFLITGLVAGALATGAAADTGATGPAQPSAMERLVRQEDARGAGSAGGGGSSRATAVPTPTGSGPIPYLSHGIGVDETLFAGQSRGANESRSTGPAQPTAIERLVRQEDARRNDPGLGITRATQVFSVPSPPRIEVVTRDSFDWVDAGVGAATALALVAALLGGMLAVRAATPRHA
jgi:hypothetical protein